MGLNVDKRGCCGSYCGHESLLWVLMWTRVVVMGLNGDMSRCCGS